MPLLPFSVTKGMLRSKSYFAWELSGEYKVKGTATFFLITGGLLDR